MVISKTMTDHEQKKIPKGEYLIIKPERGKRLTDMPNFDEFFQGLMKFQYGDTIEESNQGFNQMKKAVEKGSLEKRANSKFQRRERSEREGWGIMVYESYGHFYSFVMADDRAYDGMKEGIVRYETKFLGGKKGISDEKIDNISNYVNKLVKRLNGGESLDVEKELELIF